MERTSGEGPLLHWHSRIIRLRVLFIACNGPDSIPTMAALRTTLAEFIRGAAFRSPGSASHAYQPSALPAPLASVGTFLSALSLQLVPSTPPLPAWNAICALIF